MSASGVGLSSLLKGTGNIDDMVLRSKIPGVWLLPAGAPTSDATFLLQQKLPAILRQLRQKTDLIIIDGPALLSGADAVELATMADGVALVVDVRHERLSLLLRARDLLSSLTHVPAGVIMNYLVPRSRNQYFATAYPGSSASEKWISLQRHTSDGSEAHNGQRPEPGIAMPMTKTPAPAPYNPPSSPFPPSMSSAPRVVPPLLFQSGKNE